MDNDTPPAISFTSASSSIAEDAGSIIIDLDVSRPYSKTLR